MELKNWNIYRNHCTHKRTGYEIDFRQLFHPGSRKRVIENLKEKMWFTQADEIEIRKIGEYVFKKGTE